jgi:chemotaxis protein methyltransferase CheR
MQPATALDAGSRLSDRHFRSIAELVEAEVGIKLPAAKRLMLEGRLLKRVRALNYSEVNEYVEHLFDAVHFETELVHLIDCVTTNKTDFFREPSHFNFMKEAAVPEILRRRGRPTRTGTRQLKIWSAACSAGMEAYTIAMVLDDMIAAGTAHFQFSVLGTDISTSVLKLAETGIYTREMIAPVPAEMAKRYFLSSRDPAKDEVRVVPKLRRSTNFMRMNLMDPSYPVDRDVDIIFCRNVLIYFDKPTQRKVVEQLCTHLRPGGFFIVGHSESMIHNESAVLQQILPTIFQV